MTAPGICPWCLSPINSGAKVCKSCGASELDGWKSLGVRRHFVWLFTLTFLIIPGLVTLAFSPLWGVILIALGVGGPIALQMRVKGNYRWIAPGDRIRI